MEYSRKHSKYIQKDPKNKEHVQKMSRKYPKTCPKNIQKNTKILEILEKAAEHKIPHMASKKKVLQQKCPPQYKNSDYGVIVA